VVCGLSGDKPGGLTDAVVHTATARAAWNVCAHSVIDEDLAAIRDGVAIRSELRTGSGLFDEVLDAMSRSAELMLVEQQASLDHMRKPCSEDSCCTSWC